MGDHSTSPTCVSAEPHGPTAGSPGAIADLTAHYFGCIKISERADFLDKDKNRQLWEHELDVQLDKLYQQKRNMPDHEREEMARNAVDETILGLAFKIESQYKRTDILRQALSETKCSLCRAPDKSGQARSTVSSSDDPSCDLVSLVDHSHREWKHSEECKRGISIIREWRQKKDGGPQTTGHNNARNGCDGPDRTASDGEDMAAGRKQVRNMIKKYHQNVEFEDKDTLYDLDRDTNGYVIQWEVLRPWESQRSGSEKYLKPVSESATDHRFKGQFPDQRTSLQNLLGNNKPGDAILHRERSVEGAPRVRYIHIPHNNMKVSNHARAQMVLRPEYWRGQQHGGRRTLVHARHMRAICERISSNIWELEDNPDNIVLFMPFLHWEEDRKREKVAKIIEQETERNRRERQEAQNEAKLRRIFERRDLLRPKSLLKFETHEDGAEAYRQKFKSTREKISCVRPDGKHAHKFNEPADGLVGGGIKDKDGRKVWHVAMLTRDEHGRFKTQSKLGQFLLDAARLYEAISMYRDQRLLEKYLHHDPPLHPRRTLDQSYYWTLKSTRLRDRDQVVYRGTTMDDGNIHRLLKEKVKDDCKGQRHTWGLSSFLDRNKCASVEAPEERGAESRIGVYTWDGHPQKAEDVVCDHCRGEIRKVSRVVMVDQLWMWILDRQTIITSFPKRYGTNKSDPSGVHNSIRPRIKNARKNQIRSVFDVALIVLDECSNTFLDRTKTADRHPQVLDIFAESIGNVQNKQTMSFRHLWYWVDRASKIYNSKSKYEDTAQLHAPLLNINPEGKLQQEIRDVIDELDIMIHVNKKQREVVKRFVKNVENIYDPSGSWRDETPSSDGDGDRDYLRSRSVSKADDGPRNKGRNRKAESQEEKKRLERERDEFTWFRKQAYDLISDVGDRVDELEGLRESAESTSQGIKDLLDLKQQQASILQAWHSVRQADESVRQGRSVMIFTIVTIIFLPLSFMSSVFGMNNADIGDTNMSFRDQSMYMFPISASVILASIIFAFWAYPRTLFWSAYKYSETWLLVNSGIYDAFLRLKKRNKSLMTSKGLLQSLEGKVEQMKGRVRTCRAERAAGIGKDYRDSDSPGQAAAGSATQEKCSKSVSSTDGGTQSSGTNCWRSEDGGNERR
ncbi:hypothetical protein LX36DRAFT_626672 [Colletotrichum falcatum]|nr:hypothetical protein LX36DRAFT_626672 [Colletotrichum falcatum]